MRLAPERQEYLVDVSLLNGTLDSHIGEWGGLLLPDQGVLDELGSVVQGEVHLGAQHPEPSSSPVKLLEGRNSEMRIALENYIRN